MTIQKVPAKQSTPLPSILLRNPALDAWSYWVDAWQRGVLFLDVMQQRSKQYEEHAAKLAPHVLKFATELVMDGRKLPRPVNYVLARIAPPQGVEIDKRKRPFIIVDPRAGHGPGIGGFKADSEIGVAFKAGHPCYFIGFLPDPVPGQTIEDIIAAKAAFIEKVIALHPEADGKPAVVGNCQAGWAVMMVAAKRPELFGPIIVAGSPLSYWAGVHGENPMRYTGGLLGGTWLTALMGDFGGGKFDGAWLVSNFENLNPANTYWTKQYNLYSKIDSEAPRYLEFEKWWGGHVLLNADEMQFIADELFIGNKLATAGIVTSDGESIDLRSIRSPIIAFCSKADNITPPAQALGWILDLYQDVDDIKAHGQTIVYAVHESIGHLGIFVSGSVAKKEHDEFASNIDLIDVLPPGLYEAVMTPKERASADGGELVGGNYLVRFEARTLDDIRALGENSIDDERKFAAVANLSEINLGLYRTFIQHWVKAWANSGFAEWMRKMHPLRLPYEMFTPANPFLKSVSTLAESVRENRKPIAGDNLFWQAQERMGNAIESSLKAYGDMRDRASETMFHAIYGSALLQALVGLKASDAPPRHRPGVDAVYRAFVTQRKDELMRNVAQGGPREAAIRSLLYIRLPEDVADERGFRLLEHMRENAGSGLSLAEFKTMVRDQFFTLLLDERRAVEAIPAMLDTDPELAARMAATLRKLLELLGVESKLGKTRLAEITAMFEARKKTKAPNGAPKESEPARPSRSQAAAKPNRTHSRNLS